MRGVLLFLVFLLFVETIFAVDGFPRAQICNQEDDQGSPKSFSSSCDGSYPAACGAANDLLSCNDGQSETVAMANAGNKYDGAMVNSSDSTVTNCVSVTSVMLCHEWWVSASRTFANCVLAVDADGGGSYSDIPISCPSTSANPGVTCTNVTTTESWSCNNFFGSTANGGFGAIELQKTSTGTATLTMDLLFFNVSYTTDTTAPTVSNTAVNQSSTATSTSICVNASATDSQSTVTSVVAQIVYPDTTVSNVTMSDIGCGAGAISDGWYGASVNVGITAGTLYVNTTFANDSYSNTGYQSPYPNLQVDVTSAEVIVETTISSSSVTFGNIDPGTADTAASSNPITLTNTGNSNTAIDVYLNATNMTSASYNINSSNISVWTANAAGSSKNFNASSFINYTSANTGFIENLAISGTSDLYFWIDVNAGQQAGAYSGVIQIKVVADGATP